MSIKETLVTTLNYPLRDLLLGKEYRIRVFGDCHKDAPNFVQRVWDHVMGTWREDNEDVFYFTMSDLLDYASWGERRKIRNASMHESTLQRWDREVQRDLVELIDELDFMRGKFIGGIQGNHTWEFFTMYDGKTSDEVLCHELGGYFLGGMSTVTLDCKFKDRPNDRLFFDLHLHHGKAGGETIGNSFNQVDKMRSKFQADCYIMGHNHQAGGIPTFVKLTPKRPRHQREEPTMNFGYNEHGPWLFRSGSFLKAYKAGGYSYAAKSVYAAAQLAALEITVVFRRVRNDGEDKIVPIINCNVVR
jgi:hypothetical protein